jgi:hypothetical protein
LSKAVYNLIQLWYNNMMIKHEPIFNTDKIVEHYQEKDGVPIKYVCTSALGPQSFAVDVFYRSTPHPEFGNRYFGLYRAHDAAGTQIMITNADVIETLEFGMVQDKDGAYHYSAHRHDYKIVDGAMIDGGRAYIRHSGTAQFFKIKDGEFINE